MKIVVEIEIEKDNGWEVQDDYLVLPSPYGEESKFLFSPEHILDNLTIRADQSSDPPFQVTDVEILNVEDGFRQQILKLIRTYGEQMNHLGHLAGNRAAHTSGEHRRLAEQTYDEIEKLMISHDAS